MRPCTREQLRPKFPDAVEREVRRFAVERLQLEAVLHCRREDLLAGADSCHLLRSRKAASEKNRSSGSSLRAGFCRYSDLFRGSNNESD